MTPGTLRTLRRQLGLTQSELGVAVGLTGTPRNVGRTVRRWEAGKQTIPTDMRDRLAALCQTRGAALLDLELELTAEPNASTL